MTNFKPNDMVGAYRVLRLLGEGGMGAVYEVEHAQLGVHYALKTFILKEGHVDLFRKRFLAEGKLLARLDHPNLVKVFDLGFDERTGNLYFVMNLIAPKDEVAQTLADLPPGSVGEEQIFIWFKELCEALSYVHSQGIVHRDIKLNNILLAENGHVVLTDFGISRVTNDHLRSAVDVTKTMVTGQTGNLAMGTVGYMAPELATGGEASPAADVYSLAVSFFRLLTNVWYDPCLAPQADSASSVGLNSITLLEMFQFRWKDVLPMMLDVNPLNRPTNLADLPALLVPPAPPPSSKKPPLAFWIFGTLIAAGLIGAVMLYLSPGNPKSQAHTDSSLKDPLPSIAQTTPTQSAAPAEPTPSVQEKTTPHQEPAEEFKECFGGAELMPDEESPEL